jgi:hypothetical protein
MQDMADQPRYEPYEESSFFENQAADRPLPGGTVARGYLREDSRLYEGRTNGNLSEEFPFQITRDVLERGRDRYNIYCTPCHDRLGNGRGMAVVRGFRRGPLSFHIDRLRQEPPGYFFDVISNGFGAMSDYASQLKPEDRWAVVAYIRALQLSQHAAVQQLPESDRRQFEGLNTR